MRCISPTRVRHYDPINNRLYEYWQPVDGHPQAVCQHYRCYAPVDFRLLLEGTGLSVASWKVNYKRVHVAKGRHDTQHPLWHTNEYLVKLVLGEQ